MELESALKDIIRDLRVAYDSMNDMLSKVAASNVVPEHALVVKSLNSSINLFKSNLKELVLHYNTGNTHLSRHINL